MLAAALLFSCGENNGGSGNNADTGTTTNVETVTDEAVIETIPQDDIPADLDFGGAKMKILIREAVASTQFFVDEMDGDIIHDALYSRNRTVEERLGVDIEFIPLPGEWGDKDSFNGAIRSSVMANDGAYDLCAVLSNQLSVLTLEGLLADLNKVKYLNFDQPWWAGGLLDELVVGGKLYFASGDASLGLLDGMICFLYNKKLAENYDVGDVYGLVNSGGFTLDKMVETSRVTYADLNGNGETDLEDQFAFICASWNQIYGFIEAFELPVTEKDADGYPAKIVFDSEKVVNAVQRLAAMFNDEQGYDIRPNDVDLGPIFSSGRALYSTGEFLNMSQYRDIDTFDFGVIPFPKYDENQAEYHTGVRATYSSFCIPITAANYDMSGAVLEAFASESYRQVTPAYYEGAMKQKYARDSESTQMFDLIKNGVTFKFGVSFTMSLNDPQNTFKSVVSAKDPNWASRMQSWIVSAQASLDKTVATLKELP
jgi:hypothetical protein